MFHEIAISHSSLFAGFEDVRLLQVVQHIIDEERLDLGDSQRLDAGTGLGELGVMRQPLVLLRVELLDDAGISVHPEARKDVDLLLERVVAAAEASPQLLFV